MVTFLLNIILIIVGLAIGGTVLLAGRRLPWVSLAIVGLAATGNLLAALVAGLDSGWDLVRQGEWLLVAIAFAVAALGWYIGQTRQKVGVTLIGIVAGIDIALWLREIIQYFSTEVGVATETAVFLNLPAILIGGLLGWWLIRSYQDEALILVTVVLGIEIIFLSLRMNSESSLVAVILLSLALVGVVVQYADYLRYIKANTPLEPSVGAVMPPLT